MPSDAFASGSAAVLASPTRVRIVLAGELDLAIRSDIEEACRDARRYRLPVDLDVRNVTFMDSSIVVLIFSLAASSPLRVIGSTELVQFLFDVTGLAARVEMLEEDPGFPST
ncbi:STAS domain-containing protein [Georgenia satyanarayanai]|uniref:STAS domain-containing protein n=1 Tax=Georgenia satyanarayanai TaxID=860221 RepID=UPI00186ABDF9|nr:STAS domain-containing protein [Georgenia satyanarayanai]